MVNCLHSVGEEEKDVSNLCFWTDGSVIHWTIKEKLSFWEWKIEMRLVLIEAEVPIKYPSVTVE